MDSRRDPDHKKETVFVYDLSPQLEEELMRRARENGTDPAQEAADILEKHTREAGETD